MIKITRIEEKKTSKKASFKKQKDLAYAIAKVFDKKKLDAKIAVTAR